jgi:aminoglycoside phosphotransferase (APT) family kinase protein
MMPRNAGQAASARANRMSGLSSPLPDTRRWQLFDGSGWQFLLPPSPFRRLLCYDNLGGATLLLSVGLAEEVLVVHHDPEELERLRAIAADAGLGDVRFAHAGADLGPEGADGFDGALVHDPEARVLRRDRGPGPAVDALCARFAAVLRPRGFLYLGLRNRFAYRQLRQPSGSAPRFLSVGAATRAVRRAGLRQLPSHPFLLDGTRIAEIVPPAGYRSAKNRFLPTERIRELLLRGWGRRNLAPAYGVIGFRGTPEPSWLEHLLADPWVQSLAPRSALRRCLVLNEGKLMLSLGPARAPHGTVVLVVTPESLASDRRRAEGEWLRRLAALPPAVARVIPVFHGEREIEGVRVFALSERPGLTVDRDAPFLPALTAAAAGWLREFHRATVRPAEIDAALFARAFAPLFEKARARNRALSMEITGLEELVRSRLAGRVLPLAWMHGDFKLENLVFDERTRTVQGVIDWELAWEPGAPLLDLLYLLLYNRVVRAGTGVTGVLAAAQATLVKQDWTPDERVHLDAHHAASLGGSRGLETTLGALFLVHHIGVRVTYNLSWAETLTRLRNLLSALRERLATPDAV